MAVVHAFLVIFFGLALAAGSSAQNQAPPQKAPPVEKLGPSLFRLGQLRVDTAKQELTAPGTLNDVMTLEFVANTKNGIKAYESAITVESDAITFNAALILMGLDPGRGRPSARQFDPATPEGDAVEIHVAWGNRRVRIEELLLDQRTKTTLRDGPWVYTGSTFYDVGHGRQFLAEVDGVLIGLMHGPAAIIENPRSDAVDGFGHFVINPRLGIPPGSALTLIIKKLKTR